MDVIKLHFQIISWKSQKDAPMTILFISSKVDYNSNEIVNIRLYLF